MKTKATIVALALLAASAFGWPASTYVTATVPTNNAVAAATASTELMTGNLLGIQINLTGAAPTTTIAVATGGNVNQGVTLPSQTILTLTDNTSTNCWLFPVAEVSTNASGAGAFIPYPLSREKVTFTLTGGNGWTVQFSARVIYDHGPQN